MEKQQTTNQNRRSRPGRKAQAAKQARRRGNGGSEAPREQMIAEAAYFRAENRGFASGYEVEDWLSAEAEIDAQLAQQKR